MDNRYKNAKCDIQIEYEKNNLFKPIKDYLTKKNSIKLPE